MSEANPRPPLYDCQIFLTERLKDGDVEYWRECSLPFLPSKDVTIVFGDMDGEGDGLNYVRPDDIRYLCEENVFEVSSLFRRSHGCTCNRGEGCCEIDPQEIEDMVRRGWQHLETKWLRDRPCAEDWQFSEPGQIVIPLAELEKDEAR